MSAGRRPRAAAGAGRHQLVSLVSRLLFAWAAGGAETGLSCSRRQLPLLAIVPVAALAHPAVSRLLSPAAGVAGLQGSAAGS